MHKPPAFDDRIDAAKRQQIRMAIRMFKNHHNPPGLPPMGRKAMPTTCFGHWPAAATWNERFQLTGHAIDQTMPSRRLWVDGRGRTALDTGGLSSRFEHPCRQSAAYGNMIHVGFPIAPANTRDRRIDRDHQVDAAIQAAVRAEIDQFI